MTHPVPPGGTIGILGGGQLGRMLALAAARLGLRAHVFAPAGDNPAFDVAHAHIVASYDDEEALRRFARDVDVITYEFENVPARSVALLNELTPVRPGARALEVAQDRWREKRFAAQAGVATAPFANVEHPADLDKALRVVGLPGVLKTRRLGYDGKGQEMVHEAAQLAAAWERLGRVPCILERFVDFDCEASVVAARGAGGAFVAFDVPRNEHEARVLRISRVPSGLAPATEERAREIARRLAEALEHIGVLAVELFVMRDENGEQLLFNEMAPRVHNSGHWTEAACSISQFELHVRAVCHWPLPPPVRHSDCVMTNILGSEAHRWPELASEDNALLHLYGKEEIRKGRKMGHITHLRPRHDRT